MEKLNENMLSDVRKNAETVESKNGCSDGYG